MKTFIFKLAFLIWNCNLFSQCIVKPKQIVEIDQLFTNYRTEIGKRDNTIDILKSKNDSLTNTYKWLIKQALNSISFNLGKSNYPSTAILESNQIKVFTSSKVYYNDSESFSAIHKMNNINNVENLTEKELLHYQNQKGFIFDDSEHPLYSQHSLFEGFNFADKTPIDTIQSRINIKINNIYFSNDYSIQENNRIFNIIYNNESNFENQDKIRCSTKPLEHLIYRPGLSVKDKTIYSEVEITHIVFQNDFKYAQIFYNYYYYYGFFVFDLINKKLVFDYKELHIDYR